MNLYDTLLHINDYSYFDEEIQSKEQIIAVNVGPDNTKFSSLWT